MQNLTCEVHVVYQKTNLAKMKLVQVRVELPYGIKPVGKRIIKWHCEKNMVKMIRGLIETNRMLNATGREAVQGRFMLTLKGSSSAQASLYKPEFLVGKSIVYKTLPEGMGREFYILTKSKLSVR